jgi:protein involved in polysaccharide export with SLBB domain
MLKYLIAKLQSNISLRPGAWPFRPASVAAAALGVVLCLALSGCEETTLPPIPPPGPPDTNGVTLSLHEGDSLQIRFPGAMEMDSVQAIREDGKITIANAGDVKVSGLTPDGAAQAILAAVGDQLKVKQVTVTVQSSAFIVYVTGAVLKSGKIISDRPLNVLQAVIEAGIDPIKSNLKKVKVIRTDAAGHNTYKMLNLKNILSSGGDLTFTLKPYDTIVVAEKFVVF